MCKSTRLFLLPMKKQGAPKIVLQILCFVCWTTFGWAQKSLEASLVFHPPKLDGILESEIWGEAQSATDFVEQLPVPGGPVRQSSDVKVIYTQEALYIGFFCYDNAQDSILKQLSGRDGDGNSDWCAITINCYQDGINGFSFAVSPWGEQWDGRVTAGGDEPDVSWNAVWDCKVHTDEKGWCAEFKIPFAALRFPEKAVQEWDINFAREIRRHREVSQWNPVNPNGPGELAQMGKLKGIKDIRTPKRFFLFPYLSSYYNYSEGSPSSFSYNGGMDVKMGLSDAFTMDATLIPDFGQTISDQLILNLTPFEIEFQDNRPFFMEGTELFNKSGVLYSRRIGGTPIGAYGLYGQLNEGDVVVSNPMQSQLFNSTKISGRTKGNTGIGLMNSVTAPSFATIRDADGVERQVETQPLSNYNVFVMDQNLKNNSYITYTNTNVTRAGSIYDANVSAYNFELKDKANDWSISSWGASSLRRGEQYFTKEKLNQKGFSHGASLSRLSGNLTGSTGYYMESDGYNPNDLGYLQANNSWGQYINLAYRLYKPFGPFNRMWSELNVARESLYAPRAFSSLEIDWELGLNTKKFTTYNVSIHTEPVRAYNYFEPRVWGMKFHDFAHVEIGGWISTDYRKQLAIDVGGRYGIFENDGRTVQNFRLSPRYRINDHWMLIYVYSLQQHFGDIGFAAFHDVKDETPVFGQRDAISHTNVLTATYAVNPLMSFNCRVRHYWGYSRYHRFYELDNQGELVGTDYQGWEEGQSFSKANRNFNSFTIDFFYKWNFTPGSELNFAWKWSQIDEVSEIPSDLLQDFKTTAEIPISGSVSFRLVYFLDYRILTKNRGEAISKFM